MSQTYETVLVLIVRHDKPLPELADMAADRVYRMEAVQDVEVRAVVAPQVSALRDAA